MCVVVVSLGVVGDGGLALLVLVFFWRGFVVVSLGVGDGRLALLLMVVLFVCFCEGGVGEGGIAGWRPEQGKNERPPNQSIEQSINQSIKINQSSITGGFGVGYSIGLREKKREKKTAPSCRGRA